jgi:predicted transcriptional regulator
MSSKAVFCHVDDRIEEAIHRMGAHKVRLLPVLSKENQVVGMLSMGDILHCSEKNALAKEFVTSITGHHADRV